MSTISFKNGKFTTSDKTLSKSLSCLINEKMSRSKVAKKDLADGHHLVAITAVEKEGKQIVVTFADGKNKQVDKAYDFNSSEFIKMCHSAGTIKDKEIFNSLDCIGKSLWITIHNNDIVSTLPHIEGLEAIPFKEIIEALPEVEVYKNNISIQPEGVELNITGSHSKAKETIIKEAREMIKTVESKSKIQEEDEDSI